MLKIKYLILITNLATKTILQAKINEIKKEMPSITNLTPTNALNAKVNEVKSKMSNIANLATTIALTAVENKIPNVSNFVKKTGCNTKITEIENKITTDHDHDNYIITQEFKLTSGNFTARLARAILTSKNDIATFVKKTDLDNKLKNLNENVTSNENELNEPSQKVIEISKKGLTKNLLDKFSFLNGSKRFSSEMFQNYLVFIPAKKYIKYFSGTNWIDSWKSNGCQKKIFKI